VAILSSKADRHRQALSSRNTLVDQEPSLIQLVLQLPLPKLNFSGPGQQREKEGGMVDLASKGGCGVA